MIRAIVTDIEGTTGSIAFVHEVLFPYARRRLPQWLEANVPFPAVAEQVNEVRLAAGEPDADVSRVSDILIEWIDADRKATPLKALQGMIWEEGYANGDYTGHVYEDAVRQLRAWHAAGISLYVYSSGSVHAQKLLFGHSDHGDLTPLFNDYFDTTVGPKKESGSYRRILDTLGLPGQEVLFLSDVVEELDAAQEAGLQTTQLVREENMKTGVHCVAHGFDEVSVRGA
ncbi:acireductone synthase [Phytohalomonas tamaricis]|uniref:acireductone synthase n=1 Tax=Phytohalomonas tamaricis TaxID=2081032 RepID=UPI000D0BA20D|nr:acireductone synthase [Phytohalomonas tamaricis]